MFHLVRRWVRFRKVITVWLLSCQTTDQIEVCRSFIEHKHGEFVTLFERSLKYNNQYKELITLIEDLKRDNLYEAHHHKAFNHPQTLRPCNQNKQEAPPVIPLNSGENRSSESKRDSPTRSNQS